MCTLQPAVTAGSGVLQSRLVDDRALGLWTHPLELGVVSQHLGHRKLDTTRTYYALEQTRVATERFHQVLARKRAKALARPRRKRRRKGSVR